MEAAASTSGAAEFAFTLSVSCDPAFTETVQALARRAASLAGCPDEACARLGECVGGVFAAVIAGGATPATDLDVAVRSTARLLTVEVQCPEQIGFPVAVALDRSGTVPALRALVDRLECGEGTGRSYCRVTQLVHA